MSASSKKKLRTENASGKLTERQIAEQKEALKVKIYTVAFAVVLVAMIVIAVVVGVNSSIAASGVHEKNTIAATVGTHKLSNADLSYYYMDAVNNFNANYGSYAYLYGVDTSAPLNKQVIDETTGETWADNFIQQAVNAAQTVYAIADAANAAGFKLPADQQDQLKIMDTNLDGYATVYGYSNADDFIQAQYGKGTSKAGYLEYYERNLLASAYQAYYQDSLTYSDEQVRTADSADAAKYTAYNYTQYNLSVSKFLQPAADEAGTYTDEQRAVAAAEAESVANSLTENVTTAEEFDAAIAALAVNEGSDVHATVMTNQSYAGINSYIKEWVTDASRQAGDMGVFPVVNTTIDDNGVESQSVLSYYVVFFQGVNTNETKLINVRHILAGFSGATNEDGSYTDEVKAAAKESAEAILNEWKSGEATEDSFAALATEKTTDGGSAATGGLYADVFPGQMVAPFDAWCFEEGRQVGDTDIVETDFGFHVMYFVGESNQTYRDYLITNDLKSADMEAWFEALIANYPIVNGDTQYMAKDIILAR